MASLPDILDNGLCTGCGGCVSALGRPDFGMAMTGSGYLRPQPLALSKGEEAVLDKVCPGLGLDGLAQDEDYHPLWGPIRSLATGHAIDPEVRFRGSSGGVLTALAIGLVESGEVDFVLTNGAALDDPINNATDAKASRAELLGAAGSRYAPSSPLARVAEHLDSGKRFAFIGKPCDVAGLARLARHDPRVDKQIPYRFAFFCAGVPSRHGTLKVLEKLEVAHEDCVSFQYRGDGWPGLARATRADGTQSSMDYNSSWGSILNGHLQFRCKICPDGTGEFADIACADAWYGKDGYPDFTERDGRSLIVARTDKGRQLYERAMAEGWIAAEPLAIEEIAKMQPYQVSRKSNVLARTAALLLLGRRRPRYRRLALWQLAARAGVMGQLRNAWGTFKRSRRVTLN
ncbi:Coenzyme F420 hydrogenase/dehydrogenase, beta subunit C-terminal domain [Novosphingobium rosa]|uniref:Coenzyme F420 hydrogenase/dehydrogenase, beta subunit C-terminal domain n=1 Tax=Novosphingobium rosa TaxID=76978 RepID=UPI0008362DD6|nr:Coenzyme F420 hydrogenase/dehydrogenase, beta subunit C-terminal domain [Novosphingobium rosa]